MPNRPITLIGFMGCGKSTVGRALAISMNKLFVDMDDCITQMAGMAINDIFQVFGESGFRDYEYYVSQLLPNDAVVASGGGAFINDKTRALLQSNTITVWLDVPINILLTRLSIQRDTRPLLLGDDWEQKTIKLYNERKSYYQQSHFTVDANADINIIVKEIQKCTSNLLTV